MQALDCIGLVLSVAEDLELRDRAGARILRRDYLHYARQPSGSLLEEECARRLLELPSADPSQLVPGTVVTLRMRAGLCHGAIVTEVLGAPGLIHAHAAVGKVAEHGIDQAWQRRITAVFRFPGVDY